MIFNLDSLRLIEIGICGTSRRNTINITCLDVQSLGVEFIKLFRIREFNSNNLLGANNTVIP